MSKRPLSHKIRDFVFAVLSFVLSLLLTTLSFCLVLEATIFNKNSWIDNMNKSDYYVDKTEEVRKHLVDLGYASGLDEDFFKNVVDEIMITSDTHRYIDDYFSGKETVIDTTEFKQTFSAALDEYVEKTGKKVSDADNIQYLIKEAARVYSSDLRIPTLTSLSTYFLFAKKTVPIVMIISAVIAAGLICMYIFANRWKHRAVKYIYYASAATFLADITAAILMIVNGGITRINIESRSVYNFIVDFVTNINIAMWACSAVFLLISIALFLTYRKLLLSVSGSGSSD